MITSEEFGARKEAGKYPGGQLPLFYLDDGTAMT